MANPVHQSDAPGETNSKLIVIKLSTQAVLYLGKAHLFYTESPDTVFKKESIMGDGGNPTITLEAKKVAS